MNFPLKKFLLAVFSSVSFCGQVHSQSHDLTVSGTTISDKDLRNATPVATVTPQELIAAAASHCAKGTVHVKTDGSNFFLNAETLSFDRLSEALIRLSKKESDYCLEIIGPGADSKKLAKLSRELTDVTKIEHISWKQ